MLASSENLSLDMLDDIEYPKYASFKLDGIRCVQLCAPALKRAGCSPMGRSMKVLPNCHVQEWCENEGIAGFDGEIILNGLSFHEIQSWVMTGVTLPRPFTYYVFDCFDRKLTYLQRLQKLKVQFDRYGPKQVQLHKPSKCNSAKELRFLYLRAIEMGEEGLIVRSDAPYKQGRATFRSEAMLKMKAFEDREARIIGYEEEMENLNEKKKDERGYSKRSKHQDNLRGKGTLGAWLVEDLEDGVVFSIGSGMTADQKHYFWLNRKTMLNQILTYKCQTHGRKDKPRTPIFKGIRKD